ncbi:hypothetical protein PORY_002840 [Pneumocystis oryctolagi]|uniref:Uncharacterized protein n=1 Tax=Pneumocystis oryctolagi TaxID=42067 RepID=A0ACB7C9P3_9ASCO|nr:hypothetical protein PORY_002840 [Pneumocystis oryctolagi]
MSFKRSNLGEYQERSMWNLFQRKQGKRDEISSKNSFPSLKYVFESDNPPNPVIRPLLVRPQARDEPGIMSKEKTESKAERMDINAPKFNFYNENIKNASSSDEIKDEYIKWKNFIFAYAQDAYSLSNPPSPPTKLKTHYFVPPRPFNEADRIAAFRRYEVLIKYDSSSRRSQYSSMSNLSSCKSDDIKRLQRLVVAALNFFSTPIALVSLIDDDKCHFRCEIGLDMPYIDRDISFCAHTLLSSEPMVILDASKDWRFKGNPLVTDPPYLRFYAGAPIITSDGYTIGTLSVIDSNARLFFSSQDIRCLSQFAHMAMDEIEHLSQVIKHRNYLEANIQDFSLKSSLGFSDIDSISAINEYQMTLNSKDSMNNCIRKPSSEFALQDSDATSKIKLDQNIKKDVYPYIQMGGVHDFKNLSSFHMKILSDFKNEDKEQVIKDNFSFSSPFPYTKHDTKQKHMQHSLLSSNEATLQNHLDRTKNGVYNDSNYMESKQTLDIDKKENSQMLKNSELTPPSTPVNSKISFSNYIDKNNILKETSTTNSQAYSSNTSQPSVFATHVIACTLGLDLVYIVQISPDNRTSLESQKNESNSLAVSLDIIASCGLPYPPPVLDPVLHLRALRSEGGLIYRNPFSLNEDCPDYKVGILVPLWRDDINRSDSEDSLKELFSKSSSGVSIKCIFLVKFL